MVRSRAFAAMAARGHRAGVSTTVSGLGYVGLEYQHNNASASLRGVGRDAAYVIRKLAGQDGAPAPLSGDPGSQAALGAVPLGPDRDHRRTRNAARSVGPYGHRLLGGGAVGLARVLGGDERAVLSNDRLQVSVTRTT